MKRPQLLAIGHVTWDVEPHDVNAREPGGAVAFASVTAQRLGIEAAIVTSCADDYPIDEVTAHPDAFVRTKSRHTSTFENRYDANGERQQVLHHVADRIDVEDIPRDWRNTDMLFVGPLTQELPIDCLSTLQPRVSCVVPQGWLRKWNKTLPSPVTVSTAPPAGMSAGWDICVLSESEIEPQTMPQWRALTQNLIVTQGCQGTLLYTDADTMPVKIPSFADKVSGAGRETTGAGDVFAAAMLIRYAQTGDGYASARFASACAALSTRAPSWNAVEIPDFLSHNPVTGSGGTADIGR